MFVPLLVLTEGWFQEVIGFDADCSFCFFRLPRNESCYDVCCLLSVPFPQPRAKITDFIQTVHRLLPPGILRKPVFWSFLRPRTKQQHILWSNGKYAFVDSTYHGVAHWSNRKGGVQGAYRVEGEAEQGKRVSETHIRRRDGRSGNNWIKLICNIIILINTGYQAKEVYWWIRSSTSRIETFIFSIYFSAAPIFSLYKVISYFSTFSAYFCFISTYKSSFILIRIVFVVLLHSDSTPSPKSTRISSSSLYYWFSWT